MICDGDTKDRSKEGKASVSHLEHFDGFPLCEQGVICGDAFDGFVVRRITAMGRRIGVRSLCLHFDRTKTPHLDRSRKRILATKLSGIRLPNGECAIDRDARQSHQEEN